VIQKTDPAMPRDEQGRTVLEAKGYELPVATVATTLGLTRARRAVTDSKSARKVPTCFQDPVSQLGFANLIDQPNIDLDQVFDEMSA
jgi:hypothetical protein